MPAARKEDGAVLVEFAIVVPVLLLLVIGMLQFGIALNAWIDETHLTSSGARYAAVNQNPGEPDGVTLQDYLKRAGDTQGLRDDATVCVEFPAGSSAVGDPVKVTMSYPYELIPLLSDLGSVTITGDATMRLEAVPDSFTEGCST